MKFRYISAFSLKGLNHDTATGDRPLVSDPDAGFSAILTSAPDQHLVEADRRLAMGNAMLKAIFNSETLPADVAKSDFTPVVDRIRAERRTRVAGNPVLVITVEGDVPSMEPAVAKETQDFVLWIDGPDKETFQGPIEHRVTALLNSLLSVSGSLSGISRVTDAVIYYRADGKPIYAYTFTSGRVRAYISRRLSADQELAICERYRVLVADAELSRVQRLIRSSLETEEDVLRAFLAAWSALEIFVNKVFRSYQDALFQRMAQGRPLRAEERFLKRTQDVMSDKYRLADKFAAISMQLSPDTADDDLVILESVKKLRDSLSHGESVEEAGLPVDATRALANRYLCLHLLADACAASSAARPAPAADQPESRHS
jgi:hypothetical protein